MTFGAAVVTGKKIENIKKDTLATATPKTCPPMIRLEDDA